MRHREYPWLIIGVIDAYGAIHHQAIDRLNDQSQFHMHYWPDVHHKRWRFVMLDWKLENTVLSRDMMSESEREDVVAYIRKRYQPPPWVLQGEEWEALGRPREGAAYEKHDKKWDRIMRLNKRS